MIRTRQRYTSDAYASIVVPIEAAGIVEVDNHATGGLGLIVDESHWLQPGKVVEIVYGGAVLRGSVRHCTRTDDERHLVGLELH